MDITPYVWAVTFIFAAIIFGLSIKKGRKFVADLFPSHPSGIKIIYLMHAGVQRQLEVEILKAYWRKDDFGTKHLLFDTVETSGVQHTLAAERVLVAYTASGRILPNFHQYLEQLHKSDQILSWIGMKKGPSS